VDADRRELAWRPRQPDAREPVDALAREPERLDRPNQRLLQVPHVLPHVTAVPLQIEDRVTDELPGTMERRLPPAVRLDELDVRIVGDVHLGVLVGAPAERDYRRMLEQEHRVRHRALRDRSGDRTL